MDSVAFGEEALERAGAAFEHACFEALGGAGEFTRSFEAFDAPVEARLRLRDGPDFNDGFAVDGDGAAFAHLADDGGELGFGFVEGVSGFHTTNVVRLVRLHRDLPLRVTAEGARCHARYWMTIALRLRMASRPGALTAMPSQ